MIIQVYVNLYFYDVLLSLQQPARLQWKIEQYFTNIQDSLKFTLWKHNDKFQIKMFQFCQIFKIGLYIIMGLMLDHILFEVRA